MSSGYPRRFGAYVLLQRLGVGGMSEVDLARRASDPDAYVRLVVLKRIKAERHEDASFVRMFRDEARITSQLHHQNIAQLFDFGRVGDEYFLALEYIPGVDLREVLNAVDQQGERLPIRVALTVVSHVLAALHYAHSRVDNVGRSMNIVHRDVNPRNIMLSTRGEVKLIDFGVAKAEDRLERTRTDHVKGKFAYMAPEQVDGSGIDQRADVFAMGLTLYELVVGQGAFAGLSQVQILHKLLSTRVPPLPDGPGVSTALREVHRIATHPDKESRYPTADAMRRDIERVAETMGGLCTPSELVTFLRGLDPQMEGRLQEMISTYSGPVDLPPEETDALPVRSLFTEEVTKSVVAPQVSGVPTPPPLSDASGSGSVATGVGVAVGGMLVLLTTALVLVLLVVAGVLAYRANLTDEDPVVVQTPEDTAAPAPQPGPEPTVDPVEPAPPSPVPEVQPSPVPVVTPGPRPSPPSPSPETAPEPVAPVSVTPAPVPVAPAPVPAPEVAPAPVPPPDPVADVGTIQVTSATRGLAITIDGAPTGRVTPARIEVPVGEHRVEVDGFEARAVTVGKGLVSNVLFR